MSIEEAIYQFKIEYIKLNELKILRGRLAAIRNNQEAYNLFEEYRQLRISIRNSVELLENKDNLSRMEGELKKNKLIQEYFDCEEQLGRISSILNDIVTNEIETIYQEEYLI